MMKYQFFVFLVPAALYSVCVNTSMCLADKVRYIVTERPNITYTNHRYIEYVNMTSRRFGRSSPFYYVDMHFITLVPFGDHIAVDFIFFEYLTNVYKRSFVEMHFLVCRLVHNDMFFGSALRQGKLLGPCPYPPSDYHLYNMTVNIKSIPKSFPFRKGRIYMNLTNLAASELIVSGNIDMEIRESSIKSNNGK